MNDRDQRGEAAATEITHGGGTSGASTPSGKQGPVVGIISDRAERTGGYDTRGEVRQKIRSNLLKHLVDLRPAKAISGLHPGVEQEFAQMCLDMGIALSAVVAFRGQDAPWPASTRKAFWGLLERADEVFFSASPGYAPWKIGRQRNWVIGRSDIILIVWNGESGPIERSIETARKLGKRVRFIAPNADGGVVAAVA